MAILETLKTLGTTILGAVKSNPVAFAGGAVGGAALIYGGYRGVKYLRNRKASVPSAGIAGDVNAIPAAAAVADAQTIAAAQEIVINTNLLSMSRAEATEAGLVSEWAEALKQHLRAKQAAAK